MATVQIDPHPETEDVIMYLTPTEAKAVAAVLSYVKDKGKTYGPAADRVWNALSDAGLYDDELEYDREKQEFKDDV